MATIISRAEARVLGLKRYFTGKPCKHGHVAERTVCDGKCYACRTVAQSTFEGKENKRKRDANRYTEKREELLARNADWQARNLARRAAYARDRYATLPDGTKARDAAYRSTNLEKIRIRARAYRAANLDKVRARYAAWKVGNVEWMKKYYADWQKANRDKVREAADKRRAKVKNVLGFVRKGYRVILRGLQRGKCANCLSSLKEAGEHLDHIMPIALGGMHDESNLQLLCRSCNQKKHTKLPEVWAYENGRLL